MLMDPCSGGGTLSLCPLLSAAMAASAARVLKMADPGVAVPDSAGSVVSMVSLLSAVLDSPAPALAGAALAGVAA